MEHPQGAEAQAGYWDRIAAERRFTLPLRADWLAAHLDYRARILDFGCGYGRTLAGLKAAGYENDLGMDFSAGMLRECRAQHPAMRLVQCDGQAIPLRDKCIDLVLLVAVLTCIPADADQCALADEIQRVLHPGGLLYIADFLLNDDARNRERYERGAQEAGVYGVFRHPEGIVLRHHRPEWIAELTRAFRRLECERFEAVTMNGNRSAAFLYLGQSARP